MLTEQTNIISATDFGSNEVFEGTSAYVATIVAQKSPEHSDTVRVVKVENLSAPFMTYLLLSASNDMNQEIDNDIFTAYNSNPHPRGKSPWLLVSPSEKHSRTSLENESEFLESIAGIFQGIRTGANDIFIVETLPGEDRTLVQVINRFGENDIIERALLHPVAFGSDIKKNEPLLISKYLLYPYRNNRVIQENELKENYPNTYKYLSRYKSVLSGRASIQSSGLKWYELVRKRDSEWLTKPKLLIRDLALETSFTIDQNGSTFLVGGTAVVPYSADLLLPLLAYLNSSLITQYIRQVTPSFRGGFQKFEPQHLQRIPVLKRVLDEDDELSIFLESQAIVMLESKFSNAQDKYRDAELAIDQKLSEILSYPVN